ncbi:hypothetical protein [Georgenia deserti]|uniref:Uncharacterized protein n=1 Tax=Georgenia deserti TaxID=2093781 RepID=A0ABW4L1Z4_9MICO
MDEQTPLLRPPGEGESGRSTRWAALVPALFLPPIFALLLVSMRIETLWITIALIVLALVGVAAMGATTVALAPRSRGPARLRRPDDDAHCGRGGNGDQ